MPLEELDAVSIEHRLTILEGMISTGFMGANGRLDQINGTVARHDRFIRDFELKAAEVKGFAEGRAALRKKDLAIVGGIIAAIGLVVNYLPHMMALVERLST